MTEQVKEEDGGREERSPAAEDAATSESQGSDLLESDAEESGVDVSPELAAAVEERDRFLDELRRVKADFENYQKRVRRERPVWEAQVTRKLLEGLLPLQDNFERALAAEGEGVTLETFRDGVAMIHQLLAVFFADSGVRPIEALGERFDPQLHHAVQQIPTPDASQDGCVVDVLQKGYLHGDVVLRPAQVLVGKHVEAAAESDTPAS